MKIKKLLCLLLSVCMLAGICVLPVPASAADNASYLVKGEVTGGSFVVHIYVRDTLAYGGRLSLAYDSDVLKLADSSSLDKAVKSVYGASVTTEGHASSVLIGDGNVMFAWFSSQFTGIDARSSNREIASITFDFVNGASEKDFTRNTLGLYYVNSTMVDGWVCSAEIISNTNGRLMAYRNTAVNEEDMCIVEYDYYNSTYIPPVTYNIPVNVTSTDGTPISANVLFGNIKNETDSDGHTAFRMPKGIYFYRITASGYETKAGYFIVSERDEEFNVTLRNDRELAEDLAKELKIGFAEGDDASNVTTDLVLPTETYYGTISWTSNDNSIGEYGNVTRGYDDRTVTLTAAVTVGNETVTRDFTVTVKSRYTAEQKNAMIVAADKSALEILYAPGDSADSVTVTLKLPQTGVSGSTISWTSGNEDIIESDGTVNRPETSAPVILTAYIIRGTAVVTKQFTVIVKGLSRPAATEPPVTDEPEPSAEPENTDAPVITEEPVETEQPATDEPVETEAPDVAEPTEEPAATLPPALPEYEEFSDAELVAKVIDALEIGYARGDSAESVKNAVTLPVIGAEDTVIEWTSSEPAVITPYGGVVRQVEDTDVVLTATVSRGRVSNEKTFSLTVKAAEEIPVNPNNGQEEEITRRNRRRTSSPATQNAEGSDNSGQGAGEQTTASETGNEKQTDAKTDNTDSNTAEKKFADLDTVPWAETAINALASRGVINGTSDTTYSPRDNIRRADYVILLMKLYDLDTEITDTFEDVAADSYYYNDVSKAKTLGLISGVDDTHFAPDSSISRQDMMTITYRALEKLGRADDIPQDTLETFLDADTVSDYALESIRRLVGGGYIHGDDAGRLNPFSAATRAETAVFLYQLLD